MYMCVCIFHLFFSKIIFLLLEFSHYVTVCHIVVDSIVVTDFVSMSSEHKPDVLAWRVCSMFYIFLLMLYNSIPSLFIRIELSGPLYCWLPNSARICGVIFLIYLIKYIIWDLSYCANSCYLCSANEKHSILNKH